MFILSICCFVFLSDCSVVFCFCRDALCFPSYLINAFLKYFSPLLIVSLCSDLNFCGTLLLEKHLCRILMAISAVLFDTAFTVGSFNLVSMATRIYASLVNSTGRGPAKSNWILLLGSNTGSI